MAAKVTTPLASLDFRKVSRRVLFHLSVATGFSFVFRAVPAEGFSADKPAEGETGPFRGMKRLGWLRPVKSKDIKASPLSVGFEVLDRRGFDPARTYPYLADLGVKWARCQTGWCRCETEPGKYDFGWLDEVVDSLRQIGIQPWFCLSYGNRLYIPQADETAVGWAPVYSEQAQTAWVRFTRAIAEHFRDRVFHWEIWNEPNISQFWKPEKPNPADYVRLVSITAPEIRQRIPNAVIIGGAFAGMPADYLRQCLSAGMGQWIDRISFHPYRPVPEANYATELATFRKLLAEFDPRLRLWQGENGCPSVGGPESAGALANLEWDELRQAKWLLRRILIDLHFELELTSYFHTVDLVGYRGKTNFKGLLRGTDYSPKPAYFAYRNLCCLFDSQTKRVREGELLLGPAGHAGETGHSPGPLSPSGTTSEWEVLKEAITTVFEREGRCLAGFWYPANLQKGWTPRRVTATLKVSPRIRLECPVIIDPLEGQVFEPAHTERTAEGFVLRNLPLLDYPILITDRDVLGELSSEKPQPSER